MVVDWFSHGDDDGVVTDDQVHPTQDGTLVFGQVVADGVEALAASLVTAGSVRRVVTCACEFGGSFTPRARTTAPTPAPCS